MLFYGLKTEIKSPFRRLTIPRRMKFSMKYKSSKISTGRLPFFIL
ncbi:hypothetical protein D1BOALGB6SA_5150 [Olavius sp. associated proteobacterium Delta 1]|nr:hypothetical protein D1BOALGB6SA_5150 [Olavius sp. associated proteobacterium Delta 1]